MQTSRCGRCGCFGSHQRHRLPGFALEDVHSLVRLRPRLFVPSDLCSRRSVVLEWPSWNRWIRHRQLCSNNARVANSIGLSQVLSNLSLPWKANQILREWWLIDDKQNREIASIVDVERHGCFRHRQILSVRIHCWRYFTSPFARILVFVVFLQLSSSSVADVYRFFRQIASWTWLVKGVYGATSAHACRWLFIVCVSMTVADTLAQISPAFSGIQSWIPGSCCKYHKTIVTSFRSLPLFGR